MKTSVELNSKLPQVELSIFTKMSTLANKEKAINLSQGFPNFPVAPELVNLVVKAYKNGYNQYAPMAGIIELREAIVEKVKTLYNCSYNAENEITITAGATQAIYTAISATVNKGDEVIIFSPAYDCYGPVVTLNGGKVIEIELLAPEFKVDWQQVKTKVSHKTKMIIINTPHNPSGTVLNHADMICLQEIVYDTDMVVLSDEVYEHIIFDGNKHQSVSKYPLLAERSFVIASFGKTFHATGWKMGYCLAPESLMTEFRKTHQFNVFSVNHPVQLALATYLKNPDHYLDLSVFYQEKRDHFLNAIQDSKFSILPTKGTYFQLLGYENISDENDVDFAIKLTQEFKIASIPISVFYQNRIDNKVLRFCFAKNKETMLRAANILNKIGC